MVVKSQIVLRCLGSLVVGGAVSTGYATGITAAIAMPPLVMHQPTRRAAYESAFCYYAGALWPIVPAARNFFGASASLLDGAALWFAAVLLLASPWPFAWTTRRVHLVWRVPLALLASVVPPLGLIGWASPLTASGFLFPGTGFGGLISFLLLCSGLCAAIECPSGPADYAISRMIFGATTFVAITAHLSYPGDPPPPHGWEGVNTWFGTIAQEAASPEIEYMSAQWIQERARLSHASVIVFPETVVPRWTNVTDLFWQEAISDLSKSGKIILVGAGLPAPATHQENPSIKLQQYNFSAALATLRFDKPQPPEHRRAVASSGPPDALPYRNAVVIRGARQGTFIQRIPVPLGMWRPFGQGGVPLNVSGPGVVSIENQRAAILICYEQLLTWPVLISMLDHASVLVAVANDHWVDETSIPRYQLSAVQSWARLFCLPAVSAVNR